MNKYLYKIYNFVMSLWSSLAEVQLKRIQFISMQISNFTPEKMKDLSLELVNKNLVNENWIRFEDYMMFTYRNFPESYLRHPPFTYTISVSSFPLVGREYNLYFSTIKSQYDKCTLKKLLLSENLGKPFLVSVRYKCTFIRIQHLYQISTYKKLTNIDLFHENVKIVEFGAGYGDLAGLIFKFNEYKATYVIIDLPFLCYLQYLHLRSLLGDQVVLHTNLNDSIDDHKINIIPLNYVEKLVNYNTDLFIATYSLTESNFSVVKLLEKFYFFNSKHFLITYDSSINFEIIFKSSSIADYIKEQANLNYFYNGVDYNGNFLYK